MEAEEPARTSDAAVVASKKPRRDDTINSREAHLLHVEEQLRAAQATIIKLERENSSLKQRVAKYETPPEEDEEALVVQGRLRQGRVCEAMTLMWAMMRSEDQDIVKTVVPQHLAHAEKSAKYDVKAERGSV